MEKKALKSVHNYRYSESAQMFYVEYSVIMGTKIEVVLLELGEEKSVMLWENIVDELLYLDAKLNKFSESSELYRLNQCAKNAPFHVSQELYDLLHDCKRYAQLTNGCFDVTLKDISLLQLNHENRTVFFADPTLSVDLGGYAKGYALKKIKGMLQEAGVRRCLINFGNSTVLAIGSHPYGDCWPVGVSNPFDTTSTLSVFSLKDSALSTSGNMPSHLKHIVNPMDGSYVCGKKAVSVVCKNELDAEVLSTALMIATDEQLEAIKKNFIIDEYQIFDL